MEVFRKNRAVQKLGLLLHSGEEDEARESGAGHNRGKSDSR